MSSEEARLLVGGSVIVLCGGLQIVHKLGTSGCWHLAMQMSPPNSPELGHHIKLRCCCRRRVLLPLRIKYPRKIITVGQIMQNSQCFTTQAYWFMARRTESSTRGLILAAHWFPISTRLHAPELDTSCWKGTGIPICSAWYPDYPFPDRFRNMYCFSWTYKSRFFKVLHHRSRIFLSWSTRP